MLHKQDALVMLECVTIPNCDDCWQVQCRGVISRFAVSTVTREMSTVTPEEETDQAFVLRLFDQVRDAEEERQNSQIGITLEAEQTKKREKEFASGKSAEIVERDNLRRGESWKRQVSILFFPYAYAVIGIFEWLSERSVCP